MEKGEQIPFEKNPESEPSSAETGLTQEVGLGIDKGLTRQNNEDSLAAVTLSEASQSDYQSIGVYAVADGMGGHEAGEIASKLAVRAAVRKLMDNFTEGEEAMPDNYRRWLKGAVALANKIVRNKAQEENKNMGTTLVMAVVAGHDVHIVNVGDSRAYIITPTEIRRITNDHSFVQTLVDSGMITEEEATKHPYRNMLTQAIGSKDDITIDLFNETISEDEWLLLCSDGLWEVLGDEKIGKMVRESTSPNDACQDLIDAANAAGGYDNIAAVVVRLSTLPPKPVNEIPE